MTSSKSPIRYKDVKEYLISDPFFRFKLKCPHPSCNKTMLPLISKSVNTKPSSCYNCNNKIKLNKIIYYCFNTKQHGKVSLCKTSAFIRGNKTTISPPQPDPHNVLPPDIIPKPDPSDKNPSKIEINDDSDSDTIVDFRIKKSTKLKYHYLKLQIKYIHLYMMEYQVNIIEYLLLLINH